MSNDNKDFGIDIPISPHADEREIKYKMRAARHRLADTILENINNGRYYTIRIDEHWPDHLNERRHYARLREYGPLNDSLNYRMTVEISQVEMRHVEMYQSQGVDYGDLAFDELSHSAVGEIKRRIKRQLSRPFKWLDKRAAQVEYEKANFVG